MPSTRRPALLALPMLFGAIVATCAPPDDAGPMLADDDAGMTAPTDAAAAAAMDTGTAAVDAIARADLPRPDGSVTVDAPPPPVDAPPPPVDAPAPPMDAPAPPPVDAPAPTPVDAPAPPPPTPRGYYSSTRSAFGTVDANLTTYQYAPAFVFDGGLYHYFACVGVAGDWIQHKSAPTLAGLAAAPFRTVLSPSPGENHTCDPAVVRGADGRWYLHNSNTPGNTYTDSGVAVAARPEGPYTKISMDLLGHYTGLSPGQYGRGQTTVTLGPDGAWYMAFTNQIAPLEPNSIVVLRSPDPSFANTRTEVARIDPGAIGGWSTQLSFDPPSGHFVFIEPAGAAGFVVTSFDPSFRRVAQETLPLPPGAGAPGEGQAFLTDASGRLLTTSPGADGSLVVAGATSGPARGGLPTWITGPNQWRTYRVDPLGVVDAVAALPGAVRVAGWSYDPNDRGWSLDTHIYVGRPGGADRVGTNDGATRGARPDVNAAEGCTGQHGFDVTIRTALRGAVEVCTAAINIGTGTNTWLACRTVTVTD
jgi:hypothetical protein